MKARPTQKLHLHCLVEGPAEAQALVFLHAFPLSHKMWAAQIAACQNQYRVLAPDLRAHGQSEGGDSFYFIDHMADDILALLDEHKIESAILCGISMGGYIALRFAERYPSRLRGLILCDTRAEADTNEAKAKRAATLTIIQERGLKAFSGPFLESAFSKKTWLENKTLIEATRALLLENQADAVCRSVLALASRRDSSFVLEKISVPTCIVVGAEDDTTPVAAAQKMFEAIAGSELNIIPGVGHLSNLEAPELFNQIVLDFLKKNF